MTSTLGPYELRSELGRGAMAVVWRAYDPVLDREVALKEAVVPRGTDAVVSAELGARFVREARAAAKLSHPGIVTIYSADIYDGRPCIAMELIRGETLSAVLERGLLPAPEAVRLMSDLLDAVGYAHSRGIVHRDIKPDNIFLTQEGRLKLADFGVAHLAGGTALTQAGTIMGTPGYMAPEQITGSPIDARADIFALGVVLFEMLTGHNPFGAGTQEPVTAIMYRIVHGETPVLPETALTGLPHDLRPVLAAAMASDPQGRFPDARSFQAALRGEGPLPIAGAGFASPGASGGTLFARAAGTVKSSRVFSSWIPYVAVLGVGLVVLIVLLVMARSGGTGSAAPMVSVTTTVSATPTGQAGAASTALPVNRPPSANAGVTQQADSGAMVRLDGTGSSDPDGSSLTFQWAQTSGPVVSLSGADTPTPGFTAPGGPATLIFSLVVYDGQITSSSTSVTINVSAAPTTSLGVPDAAAFTACETVVRTYLDEITNYNYAGGDLTIAWQQLSGKIQARLPYSRFVEVFSSTAFRNTYVHDSRRVNANSIVLSTSWEYYDSLRDSGWQTSSGDWELQLVSGRWVITGTPF